MDTNVAPELTNTTQFKCRRARCREQNLVLGEIVEENQAIEFGNVRIWHIVRFSCSNCHKSYRFEPAPLNDLIPLDVLENEYGF
jgi:nitrate/TMAO reductase-like tetraheme cytochrome c subunit